MELFSYISLLINQVKQGLNTPYGTTDGYINTLRGELRLNGLEIYVSNEG